MDTPESSRNLKGYKIRNSRSRDSKGVAASNLLDLIEKGKQKLKIPENEEVQIFWKGTEVREDEDFQRLPNQAECVFQRTVETYDDDGDRLCHVFGMLSISVAQEEGGSFVDSLDCNERPMKEHLESLPKDFEAENRSQHEDWFKGLGSKWESKTGWMREVAARRIRKYFRDAEEKMTGVEAGKLNKILKTLKWLKENAQAQKKITEDGIKKLERILKEVRSLLKNAKGKMTGVEVGKLEEILKTLESLKEKAQITEEGIKKLEQILKEVRSLLKNAREKVTKEEKEKIDETLKTLETHLENADYNKCFFDRSASDKDRMCDESGQFCCNGRYGKGRCEPKHSINPYASKDYRLMFRKWELDHIIEKSFALESFIEAARRDTPQGHRLDKDKLYELLFTRSNLNLVYTDCHDRSPRQNEPIAWIIPAV